MKAVRMVTRTEASRLAEEMEWWFGTPVVVDVRGKEALLCVYETTSADLLHRMSEYADGWMACARHYSKKEN